MAELATNHNMGFPRDQLSQQYSRMIPGISAPSPRSGSAGRVVSQEIGGRGETPATIRRKTFVQWLLPRPMADPWSLYQSVVADFIVLGLVYIVQTRVFAALSFQGPIFLLFGTLVTLFGFSEGIYENARARLSPEILPGLARSVVFAALLVFVAERGSANALAVPTTCLSSLSGLLLYRYLVQVLWARQQRESEPRRVLLVGAGPIGRSIARGLHADHSSHIKVQGFVDDDLPLSPDVLGRVDDLDWLARGEFIDEVILALPGQPEIARDAAAIALRNHLDIRAVPDLPPGRWPDAAVDYIGEVPVVTLHREPLPTAGLFLKRVMDLAAAMLCLILSAPLMGLVGLLIRLESPGPVFYSAERTGAKGRRFRCYKFRSMVSNADQLKNDLRAQNQRQGPIFKIVEDPRITRVGRFIRRYSLDELPQLWNVLRGEMSLVGPRPHPVDEVNHYQLHHYRRLDVKPGITGLWQISARHSPSFDLNMHLDLTYIENWNLRLDLRILLKTIGVLFAPEGA